MWKLLTKLTKKHGFVSLFFFFWDWITWDKTMGKTMDSMNILWGYGMGTLVVPPSWIQRNPLSIGTDNPMKKRGKEHPRPFLKQSTHV
jgi:hypothetical protein